MSDREMLELIARRLEGDDELIASCRNAFERCAEAARINKETREENIKALDRAVATMNRLDEGLNRFDDKLAISNAFISDMVRRVEVAGQRSDAWFELMLGRLEALTEAVMRMVDRLDDGPATA